MDKNSYKLVKLPKGEVAVYDLDATTLHAYKTNDPMTDEVFILEKNGRALILESPSFVDNVKELTEYVGTLSSKVEALVLSYHLAGGTFLPDVPVYATKNADKHGHSGGGKTLVDNFVKAFGATFDASIPTVTHTINTGPVKIAGFTLNIIPTPDAFDVRIPELSIAYIHMMGHDGHSIVSGAHHADSLIAQLKDLIARNFALILTSHHTPEDLKDAQTKIDYLETLKATAAASPDAAAFKQSMLKKYPTYTGEHYLDMTAGFFFPS